MVGTTPAPRTKNIEAKIGILVGVGMMALTAIIGVTLSNLTDLPLIEAIWQASLTALLTTNAIQYIDATLF